MKNIAILLGCLLFANLSAETVDATPFSEKSRKLELLALELSEKRGMTPQQLLSEYYSSNTPTMKAIKELKREYETDIQKIKNSLSSAKKTVKLKLVENQIQEKAQYMHRMESFKLFKEEYKNNVYARDDIKANEKKATELEIKHAEYVLNTKKNIEALKNKFFVPESGLMDEKTEEFFKVRVAVLKKLEEEYSILVREEEANINEYLETIKLAKEKIILKNHNLIRRLIETKTLDLVD